MAASKSRDAGHGSVSNAKLSGEDVPPDFVTFLLTREDN